jgi:hypothetical protein
MSGIIGHTQFIMACEDMITAIDTEIQCGDRDVLIRVRLGVARHMIREALRFGAAASRLIACDIGTETFDEEVTRDP